MLTPVSRLAWVLGNARIVGEPPRVRAGAAVRCAPGLADRPAFDLVVAFVVPAAAVLDLAPLLSVPAGAALAALLPVGVWLAFAVPAGAFLGGRSAVGLIFLADRCPPALSAVSSSPGLAAARLMPEGPLARVLLVFMLRKWVLLSRARPGMVACVLVKTKGRVVL